MRYLPRLFMDSLPTAKSLQAHIDDAPNLSPIQWRIWGLAAMGKLFEGAVVFLTGVAIPLVEKDFNLSTTLKGSVAAATLFGILVGASLFGNIADRLGRRFVFCLEILLFTVFIALAALAWNPGSLVLFLFLAGVALGADYPTAHLIISESMPSRLRGRLVLGAFTFQSVGALLGVFTGLLLLRLDPRVSAWHWMYAVMIIPGLIVFWLRTSLPESAHWLLAQQRHEQAYIAARKLFGHPVQLLPHRMTNSGSSGSAKLNFVALFSPTYIRATILSAVPWFLQDLSTYGIGIFTPTILATLFTKTEPNFILKEMVAVQGSGAVDSFLLIGFITSVCLVDRVGRIPLQIFGFIGCALGLAIAALSYGVVPAEHELKIVLIFGGFMLFNFMTNLGPNAMTYVLAGEVFPVEIRGAGAGFAASFAKIGAVCTALCFPVLRQSLGTENLLYLLALASLVGALVTYLCRIETRGKNLEATFSQAPTPPGVGTPEVSPS